MNTHLLFKEMLEVKECLKKGQNDLAQQKTEFIIDILVNEIQK